VCVCERERERERERDRQTNTLQHIQSTHLGMIRLWFTPNMVCVCRLTTLACGSSTATPRDTHLCQVILDVIMNTYALHVTK
jgi:hypothetical protein